MSSIKKARNLSPVVTACVTVAAASFALGYVLVPAWAEAGEATPAAGMVSISPPAPRMTFPIEIDQSVISGNVMVGASGAMGVNIAAGDRNQQANAAAIAYNPQGVASVQTGTLQGSRNIRGSLPDVARTRIEDNAFANTSGILAVNQASGFANSQANSTAIVLGIKGVEIADSVLAATVPNATGLVTAGEDQTVIRDVSVSQTAFQNAQGVVQLNQTAGSHNDSANNFVLLLLEAP